MDLDEIFMEENVERKTEYIIPYQDNGIGNKINLKVVGVLWAILLLLKIICKDEDWGFFLMFTALLLLFILPFFITKEMTKDVKIAVKNKENVESSGSSSTTLELPSPPISSDSSDENPVFDVVKPDVRSRSELFEALPAAPSPSPRSSKDSTSAAEEPFSSSSEEEPPKQKKKKGKKQKKTNRSISLSLEEKTEQPKYTLFYESGEEEKEENQPTRSKSISPVKPKKNKKQRKTSSSRRSSIPAGPADYALLEKAKGGKKQRTTRSHEEKTDDSNYTLFYKAEQKKEEETESKQESSEDERKSAQYALLKREKATEKLKTIKETEKKDEPQYTLFKKDPSEEDLSKITTIFIDEDIFKGSGDDEERTIEARLEIQKEPSQNPGEDDKFKYGLSIEVDPDLKDHLTVDVHGQVDGKNMDVLTHAATEGEGTADVRAEIRYGDDKDEDEVNLSVSENSDSDSDEMKLRAGRNRKKSKRSKTSGKGKKGSNTDKTK